MNVSKAVLRLALRDASRQWKLLTFSVIAFAIGIAAIVSLSALVRVIERGLDDQSKTLLGADLSVSSKAPFSEEVLSVIRATPEARYAEEISFTSMMAVSGNANSRLVQLRALAPGYPFYGEVETKPKVGIAELSRPHRPFPAIIDSVLAYQFGLQQGSTFKIGEANFEVIAELQRFPGENIARALFAPRVLVPHEAALATGLISYGSRVTYRLNVALSNLQQRDQLLAALQQLSDRHSLRIDTVALRQAELGSIVKSVYRYLGLLGFLALALGAVGIATTVHVITNDKRDMVATLRCLGMTGPEVVSLVVIQSLGLGLLSSLIGILLSGGVISLLAASLKDIMPISVTTHLDWASLGFGVLVGILFSFAFALIPARTLLAVSPAAAFREENGENSASLIALLTSTGLLAIAGFLSGWWFLSSALYAALAVVGFAVILAIFLGGAKLLTVALIILLRRQIPFLTRHALANLARQSRKTAVVVAAVGLGCFLLTVLSLLRGTLLNEVRFSGGSGRPNAILFDIQDDQRELVRDVAKKVGVTLEAPVPIVPMNIVSLRGKKVAELRAQPNSSIPDWTLRREYRATYRSNLVPSERVLAGEWRVTHESGLIPISVEEGLAKDMQLKLGDPLSFNIQGVQLDTVVASIRKVDWKRFQLNFFILFPEGVLESAPQSYATTARIDSASRLSSLQQELLSVASNVSTIDLTLVIAVVDELLAKFELVLRVLGWITIAVGLSVLATAVVMSQLSRRLETSLLRLLGMTRKELIISQLIEQGVLALLTVLLGAGLGLLVAAIVGRVLLEMRFVVDLQALFLPMLLCFLSVLLVGSVSMRFVTVEKQ